MNLLLSFVTIVFVALALPAALMFGLALMIWFMALALVAAVCLSARMAWLRGKYGGEPRRDMDGIIEVDYKDVSNRE